MKRKGLAVLAALVLLILPAAGVCASEPETVTLRGLYDLGEQLLFHTDNVTIRGNADFLLEDTVFKHADCVFIHAGGNSYQQVYLSAPQKDGTTLENGYDVLGIGEETHVREKYKGRNHTKFYYREPTESLVQESVLLNQIAALGAAVADQLDEKLEGKAQVSAIDGGGTQTELALVHDDLPATVDPMLNLCWQVAIRKFLGMDTLYMTPEAAFLSIEDFGTTTQGIAGTTRAVSLRSLALKIGQDAERRISGVSGEAVLDLLDRAGETHVLTVRFEGTAEAYGSSEVPSVESLKNSSPQDSDPPAVPDFRSVMNVREIEDTEEAADYAKEIFAMDYFGVDDVDEYEWRVDRADSGDFEAWGIHPTDVPAHYLMARFSPEGVIHQVKNAASDMDMIGERYFEKFETDEYEIFRTALSDVLFGMTEALQPGSTAAIADYVAENAQNGIYYAAYNGDFAYQDRIFTLFYTEKDMETNTRTKFLVQIAPEVRVVYFDNQTDGAEGGNG